MTQSALGTTLAVPGPAGEIEVEIPAGTQPGDVHVLRGQGMPSLEGRRRGNFHVHARVHVPRRLDEAQRALIEQLERGPRRRAVPRDDDDDGGLFGRHQERVPLTMAEVPPRAAYRPARAGSGRRTRSTTSGAATSRASVARGLPAHVTVLFPFAGARDRSTLTSVRRSPSTSRRSRRSPPSSTRVGRFDAHVWLAPEPHERFVGAAGRTRTPASREFPPYGDAFAEPVPHLTIAEIGKGEHRAASPSRPSASSRRASRSRSRSTDVGLFEELADGLAASPTASSSDDGRFVRVSASRPARAGGGGARGRDRARARRLRGDGDGRDARPPLYVDESAVEAIRAAFADVEVTPVRAGLGGRLARVPPPGTGRWALDRPAVGAARPRRARGRDRSGPRLRHRRASDDPPLHRAARHARERGSLLDVGCGSGVLSIAAARLGFDPIRAVDNDPVAVETTIANAAVNGVVLEATVLDGESDELPSADVAVANVLLAAGREDPRAARRRGSRSPPAT